ncbi:UvrD-helicase domain-containing protein [Candidatus Poriferisodalis sp.]|uniref:UvrD-helicase domain-containing protein n=1 Tax=Candidatus Poriferisodalis sp. TaxID=3101277 RepID=UPI003B018119
MRVLPSVTPTPEQLKVLADVKPGFRIIRGAAGSGKTTTALLRLKEQIRVRLDRRERLGHEAPVRVLVLTFNRTLEGYIAELARNSTPQDDALDLEIKTFGRWARSLVGNVDIVDGDEIVAMLRPHIDSFATKRQHEFFVDEVQYVMGRFEYDPVDFDPDDLSGYLTVDREGRGKAPRVAQPTREKLIYGVIPTYMDSKRQRGKIDWSDLTMLASAASSYKAYDVVIVDEAQDFSANQIRAIQQHLQDPHNTTFVLDAVQRIYPQYFKWREVGISARPEIIHTLKTNYRNTAEIAAFAYPLVEGLPLEDDGTLPDFEACRRSGAKPLVVAGKYSDQLEVMLDRLESVADLEQESVVLLQPRGGGWFSEARKVLAERGIPFCELTRQNEWPTGPEVAALCTMHSAKGLEFDHVLLPGLSQRVTPHGADEGDADLERLRRMLAMAVGRARTSVMVGYKPGEESSLIGLLDPSTYELVST